MNISCSYISALQDPTGYGEAARAFVSALHLAGVDVTTETVVQTSFKAEYGWEGVLVKQLENRRIPYRVKIIHLTPDIATKYFTKGCYHIQHLFWETDKLPEEWIAPLNQMNEIWVSSLHMKKLVESNGVNVPIYAFPQPIDITHADKNYEPYQIPYHKGFMFYSIFQWIDRKNPQALLRAYWEAFEGRQDVTLLLKTFRFNYGNDEFAKIREDINKWKIGFGPDFIFPKVLLVKDLLTKEAMMRIHRTGDCFIATDRGEGWNRCLHEALLMGKTAISTCRGGIHEYLNDEHYFRLEDTRVPVIENPLIKYYTADQHWFDVDIGHLKKTMWFVFNKNSIASAKGVVAKDHVKNLFSYHKIGQQMLERLRVIYQTLV